MISLLDVLEFFGWAALLNLGVLIISTIGIISLKGFVAGIHSRLVGVPERDLISMYFNYLAIYKALTLIFFVVPYIALRIMVQ